jgi:hypothetical protein
VLAFGTGSDSASIKWFSVVDMFRSADISARNRGGGSTRRTSLQCYWLSQTQRQHLAMSQVSAILEYNQVSICAQCDDLIHLHVAQLYQSVCHHCFTFKRITSYELEE